MNKLMAIGAGVVASLAVPGAALAVPTDTAVAPTRVPLVNDCGNGSLNGTCQALDGTGTFAGIVKYRPKPNGNLRLMIVAKAAQPQHSYQLEIYCGTGPDRPGRQVGVIPDAIVTDQLGVATAGPFEVPAADMQAACGTGPTLGHLQLTDGARGSILTAAPIMMAMP